MQELASGDKEVGDDAEPKFKDFDRVVKGAKEYEGFFHLYRKKDRLYAEILPDQLETPFLCLVNIARGMHFGGDAVHMGNESILLFKRVDDKIFLIRRNLIARADKNSPIAHAVDTDYHDSVLKALRIESIHPARQSVLVNWNDVFMADFAGLQKNLGVGALDVERSSWHKVKAFPRNVELYVEATFDSSDSPIAAQLAEAVPDLRSNTAVIHYGLCKLPDDDYHPRVADDRVGHFYTFAKDYSSETYDTMYRFYITRWRLERSTPFDPKHPDRLSPPKKRIVYWIDKSVPHEYRTAVRDGVLEWNKAFAKIGFRDAIEVRQQENEDFDPEDINYSTIRWVASDDETGSGQFRANPLTGELLQAAIIIDASLVRSWEPEQRLFHLTGGQANLPMKMVGEDLTRPCSAAMPDPFAGQGWRTTPRALSLRSRCRRCLCGTRLAYGLRMAAMLEASRDPQKGKEPSDEMLQQAVKYIIMHEVGHTLGLLHNFKGSAMLPNKQLHDTAITSQKGLVGSVMDYVQVNLASKGSKQGDYFPTIVGPYDSWAIEYAYKPFSEGGVVGASSVKELDAARLMEALNSSADGKGSSDSDDSEKAKLAKIGSRCANPDLNYATDEDLQGSDPQALAWDIGADPLEFVRERVHLADELFKDLPDRVVDKGESYARARSAFRTLLSQFAIAGTIAARYIGGEAAHRDHRGDPGAREPFVPTPSEKQREALKFLQEHIFADRHFQFPPQLLRRLGFNYFEMSGGAAEGLSLQEYVLDIQIAPVKALLSAPKLWRVQNVAFRSEAKERPLTLAEVFRSLTDGVWGGQPAGADEHSPVETSVFRRNLQRSYLKQLGELALGTRQADAAPQSARAKAAPAEARSLSKLHLREIDKYINKLLNDREIAKDDTARAHCEDCREYIAKVFAASLQLRE